MDAGESLAECVVRETAEEAGVKINPDSFELVDSNHWPNPAGSLMLGSIVTTKTEVNNYLVSLFRTSSFGTGIVQSHPSIERRGCKKKFKKKNIQVNNCSFIHFFLEPLHSIDVFALCTVPIAPIRSKK